MNLCKDLGGQTCLSSLILVALCGTFADGGIISFATTSVDNSSELTNMVTTDFTVDFSGEYTGSQLLLELDSDGSIYQDVAGLAIPQTQIIVDTFPSAAFDTFVAQGSAINTLDPATTPSLGGGAVDLGGEVVPQFDEDRINQAWNPAGGVEILDQSGFMTARITLSDDANGTFSYLASADQEISIFRGTINNGQFVPVPEPSTAFVLLLGFVALHRPYRRLLSR